MNRRLARICQLLNHYFPDPTPPLHHTNPYTLLVAVLLSARTTDRQVNRVTEGLFARATCPEEMLLLSVEEILEIIRPVGLSPRKAQAIYDLSALLVAHYDSQVPSALEALEKLPGVGHKTASVVQTQAFHLPAFPVDTHILRTAHRWKLSKGKSPSAVERDLKNQFAPEEWGRIHLQIILYARRYCPARGHDPQQCPICAALNEEDSSAQR